MLNLLVKFITNIALHFKARTPRVLSEYCQRCINLFSTKKEENVSLSLIGLKDYKHWESFFLEDKVEIGYFRESPGVLAINARQENIWLKTQPAYQVVHKASLQVSQVITSDKFGQANRFKLTIFNTEFVPEYFYTKRNPSCTGKRFSICMHIYIYIYI